MALRLLNPAATVSQQLSCELNPGWDRRSCKLSCHQCMFTERVGGVELLQQHVQLQFGSSARHL